MALGVLVLGERITLAMAGAFVLILGGSVLATRGPRGAAAAAEPGDRGRGRRAVAGAQPAARA